MPSTVVMRPRRIMALTIVTILVAVESPLSEQAVVRSASIAQVPIATPEIVRCDPYDGPPMLHRFNAIGSVHLDWGSYEFSLTDIGDASAIAGMFTRTYNSLDTRTTLLGRGWTNNFEVGLRKDPNQSDLLFTKADGSVERFKNAVGLNQAVGSHDHSRTLKRNPSDWVVTDEFGTEWRFNLAGSLVQVDTAEGDWVKISHEPDLARSRGPDGPALQFGLVPTSAFTASRPQGTPTPSSCSTMTRPADWFASSPPPGQFASTPMKVTANASPRFQTAAAASS